MDKIILRDYQEYCIKKINEFIPNNETILIQAATGAGKTIIFSALSCRLLNKFPNIRIIIVTHLHQIVRQNIKKMSLFIPDHKIGSACYSLNIPIEIDKNLIIGSIQTLTSRCNELLRTDLLIIDEAHRVPPQSIDSQYKTLIDNLKYKNNNIRIIGFTATPYRLGHGYIYGDSLKTYNLFNSLSYCISIKELQKLGFLCEYKAKHIKDIGDELSKIKVNGDYNIGELSNLMVGVKHLESILYALNDYAKERKHIVIFCVTIRHAEKLHEKLIKNGYRSAVIHSNFPVEYNKMIIKNFNEGKIKILCNVGMLTEGWDSPIVDCVVMARPTKSTALYVQMIGRGLRVNENKKDVLILDLSNNCISHGDPNNPLVISKNNNKKKEPLVKICPKCFSVISHSYKTCPECKEKFKFVFNDSEYNNSRHHLKDVNFNKFNKELIVTIKYTTHDIFISKAGNRMLKGTFYCHSDTGEEIIVSEFFDFNGEGSIYGMKRAKKIWNLIVQTSVPESVDEADDRYGELIMSLPNHLKVRKENGWWRLCWSI